MAMNLMPPSTALIHQRQLEQRPNVARIARQGDEERDVRGVLLRILPVGVEVDHPVVSPDGEDVALDVPPRAHAFGEGVASDREFVRSVHRLHYGCRYGIGIRSVYTGGGGHGRRRF